MAIKEVLMIGNPKLREKSKDITSFGHSLKYLIDDLKDTLTHLQKTKNIGRALAAPQIGYMYKALFMQIPKRTLVMLNPKITWKNDEKFEVWDSCFSFDTAFFVKIQRHKKIKVDYQDENGNLKSEKFEGSMSELFQHEIDHFYGILATDHIIDPKQIIMRDEWEKRYKKA